MSVLGNFIVFEPKVKKCLKVDRHWLEQRKVYDKHAKRDKMLTTLRLHVIQEDGEPVDKELGITSEKFAQQIMPHLRKADFAKKTYCVIMSGEGFTREYALEVR